MIRSMTGYGQAVVELPQMRLTIALRSVNNRFADVRLKLPQELARAESELRRKVLSRVRRGRVEVTLHVERLPDGETRPALNRDLLREALEARVVLRDEFGLEGDLDLATALSLNGMFRAEATDTAWDDAGLEALGLAVERAVEALDQDRLREGRALQQDLLRRVERMRDLTTEARRLADGQADRIRDRLAERVQALVGDVELDPARVAQEVVLLAERADVTEEIVRLEGHVEQARALLEDTQGKPVGKRMDFLLQEIHRETNTLGSKSADLGLTRSGLALKLEAERIREQVQNLE